MALLVLGLILLLALLLMVSGAIFSIVLLTRHWNVVRPVVVMGLLLLGALAFFDALAAKQVVRCAEDQSEKKKQQRNLFGDPNEGSKTRPADISLTDLTAPEWTRRKPGEMNTAQETVEVTVHAGPCLSRADCEVELAKELIRTVDDYVRSEIANAPGVDVEVPPQLIKETLVKATHVSHSKREVLSSLGPQEMVDLYALVKIDRDAREQLRDLWREKVVQGRMKAAGAALVGVLAALTLGWAILRRPPKQILVLNDVP